MNNKRKIIYWSLLIAWMILIFVMSNQPAKVSDSQSIVVLDLFFKVRDKYKWTFWKPCEFCC